MSRVSVKWTQIAAPSDRVRARMSLVWEDKGNPTYLYQYLYEPVADVFIRHEIIRGGGPSQWWQSTEGFGR